MSERLLLKKRTKALFRKKVAALAAVADELPCVVIILKMNDLTVEYMSRRGVELLGTTLEELKEMGTDYHHRFFNPEDVADYLPKIRTLLQHNDENEVTSFFQQVRFVGKEEWNWHLSTIRIFMKDDEGRPAYCIVTAHTIRSLEHVNMKVNRLLEENTFLRDKRDVFLSLTRREREVLRLLALGKDSNEIAKELYISAKTAKTHRKNLRKKLQAQSSYDITRFAQAFDLI